ALARSDAAHVRSGTPFIILFAPARSKERAALRGEEPDQDGSADAIRCRRSEAAKFNQEKATMPNDPTATPTELHWLTIADAARLIEKRRLSPVELIDALLARSSHATTPPIGVFGTL